IWNSYEYRPFINPPNLSQIAIRHPLSGDPDRPRALAITSRGHRLALELSPGAHTSNWPVSWKPWTQTYVPPLEDISKSLKPGVRVDRTVLIVQAVDEASVTEELIELVVSKIIEIVDENKDDLEEDIGDELEENIQPWLDDVLEAMEDASSAAADAAREVPVPTAEVAKLGFKILEYVLGYVKERVGEAQFNAAINISHLTIVSGDGEEIHNFVALSKTEDGGASISAPPQKSLQGGDWEGDQQNHLVDHGFPLDFAPSPALYWEGYNELPFLSGGGASVTRMAGVEDFMLHVTDDFVFWPDAPKYGGRYFVRLEGPGDPEERADYVVAIRSETRPVGFGN
ncbi:MAG: hypothetical protein KDC38_19760, partial [Planctomycetes bacterium]|nr:hypothetical protein [Planctomycetota bacterium]